MHTSHSPTARYWYLGSIGVLVIIFFAQKSCTKESGVKKGILPPSPLQQKDNPQAAPSQMTPPILSPSTDRPPPPPSGASPTGEGVVALMLQFRNDRLVETGARTPLPGVTARAERRIEGQTGLYHRVIGPSGEVLFDNIVPDPRQVHWDTTDDGKTLKGGIATLPDAPIQLRIPAGLHGRVEIFLITKSDWSRSSLDKTTQLVGNFLLP